VRAAAEAHPDKRIALWCQDEARVGQKGRTGHRWWIRGERPPGLCDKHFEFAYIFGAVRPATGEAFALVLPTVSAAAMDLFLAELAKTIPDDQHVVMLLDQAGWHGAKALNLPKAITLVPLPPYSPELNPVERLWLHLRERYLSHRLLADYDAVLDACCDAWNAVAAEPERIRSLCDYPYLRSIAS
jgi:transposase